MLLQAIEDPRSMTVITRARKRLMLEEIGAVRWDHFSNHGARLRAGLAQIRWDAPLAKIGMGKPVGLEALLAALRLCETEHPQTSTLKNFGPGLHPSVVLQTN